jgi:E3 ubiquitin-protein ligase HECTD1
MDDVGQTLLNWASAFGTQEMVEFLCDRGADVNKGNSHGLFWKSQIF